MDFYKRKIQPAALSFNGLNRRLDFVFPNFLRILSLWNQQPPGDLLHR